MTVFNNWRFLKRHKKQTEKIVFHFHNILRLFDVLQTFCFTASETMGDYYLLTWHMGDASRAAERLKT